MGIYETCLPEYGRLLPELADIIGADYRGGSYREALRNFERSDADCGEFKLAGKHASLTILFERYEAYFLGKLEGEGPRFQEARERLYREYIDRGGNPDAQEKP